MRVIIIGQGIAGTWLSYRLLKAGVDVLVMDEEKPNSATRVASGVINPVTGRQVVTTWMADTLLPIAQKAYTELSDWLGVSGFKNCGIMAFPPSEQMLNAYQQKIEEGTAYVSALHEATQYANYFQYHYGAVHIQPGYWIDLQTILATYREGLKKNGRLLEEPYIEGKLEVSEKGVQYRNLEADYIFYCQGTQIAHSSFWKDLPFSFNKGEALIVDIPGLPHGHIYKFGISTLVPWHDGKWWVGSTYDNRFSDEMPTDSFRKKMEIFLQQTLKLPFIIKDHLAAIRPATVERRPFAGLHPRHQRVGILGGLGTKGVSLAPWLSGQMVDLLLTGEPLHPHVDVLRFRRAFQ
jgi:glycine/D-amino acid oxidase-like deaminating enzyme